MRLPREKGSLIFHSFYSAMMTPNHRSSFGNNASKACSITDLRRITPTSLPSPSTTGSFLNCFLARIRATSPTCWSGVAATTLCVAMSITFLPESACTLEATVSSSNTTIVEPVPVETVRDS